ncbi:hypothetical protein CAEBREN_01680 [Caenorhabditis brenneri]|uniref:BRCT domain-containing protein n=1 Tax=Caenorhabditis brenneri TaxID=135651 RepID=G0MFZ2_CAEBE|nr:hypothetical protein CAEBREN_01680 [Caenorhabditis brenneri]
MRAHFYLAIILIIVGNTKNQKTDHDDFENDNYGLGKNLDLDDGIEDDGDMEFAEFEKKKSAPTLEIVYNHLAILTRITSAISLQYAAIKKTVRVRDVVTELLGSRSVDLDHLAVLDASEMIRILDERFKASQEMVGYLKDSGTLDKTRPLLDLMSRAMNYVQGDSINDTKMESFYKRIETHSFDSKTIGCPAEFVTKMADFLPVLTDSSDHESDRKGSLIRELKKENQTILDCFETLENYETSISELKLEFDNFLKINAAKDGILKFHEHKDVVANFGKNIDLIIEIFSKTEKFWKHSAVGTSISNIYNQLLNIVSPIREKVDLSLTLGFPDHGDMAKVSKDLRSDWFREKVAGGKNAGRLGRELQGFFRFGVLMRKLERSWFVLRDNFSIYKGPVLFFLQYLIEIEKQELGGNALEIAKASKIAFEKSWTQELSFDKDELNSIDMEMESLSKIMQVVGTIEAKAIDIGKEIDKEAIKSFFDQLNSAELGDDEVKNINKVKAFSNIESMKSLCDKFSKLIEPQTDLKKNLEAVRKDIKAHQGSSKMADKIGKSGLKRNLDQLKKQGENFQPDVLLKMTTVIGAIFQIAHASDHYQKTKDFLQLFEAIRRNLLECEAYVKRIGPTFKKTHDENDHDNPILKMVNSQEMALSLARGMYVLRDMVRAIRMKRRLRKTLNYKPNIESKIIDFNQNDYVREFWKNNKKSIRKLLEDLEKLNEYAETVKDGPLLTVRKVLDEAAKIQGFPEVFKHIAIQFQGFDAYSKQRKNFEELAKLDLDFASHKGYLHAASMSFDELKAYFDDVFGLNKEARQEIEQNHLAAALICVAIFLLIIIGVLIVYGITPAGRRKYKNYYLYYFGKPEDFEKRWRYSLFMDRQDGKNALLDAAREINSTNVLKALRRGAYINVFNRYGNTALHVATKRGHPEIVDLLIRHGADRTLLNALNKTPEQMIPEDYRKNHPDKIDRFEAVERLYKKYQKKKFRQRVPLEFPVSSYHIYVDNTTDDTLTDNFTARFQSITTDEASLTTTHFIVRTDKAGILETESLELIAWVLSGVIVVRDKWMVECLKDEKQIGNEWDYLVKKIRYRGTVYSTVCQWREEMSKSTMPYLQGVYVAVVIPEYVNHVALVSIVNTHGGTVLDKFPEKQNFNQGFRPYLHVTMGPFVIIHDGTINLDIYKNDPDKMYTLMTEQEFVHFLLERKIRRNKSTHVIPALNDMED